MKCLICDICKKPLSRSRFKIKRKFLTPTADWDCGKDICEECMFAFIDFMEERSKTK